MQDGADAPPDPRQDRLDGVAWAGLGAAVLAGSLAMDRLADQDINPYTIPGLLPALLGVALIAMGGLMALRGFRARGVPAATALPRHAGRIALVIALCVGFGAGLVGHGLPFWLAATVFVTAAVVLLGGASRRTGRGAGLALATGLAAGWTITFVFQDLFLVRLP